jgi:putative membrane protein
LIGHKAFISQGERQRVTEAIAAAETITAGEIVAVISPASSQYFYAPFFWGSLAALAVPIPLTFWTWLTIQQIYLIQLGVFAVLLLLLSIRPIRMALVPSTIKHHRSHQRAIEQCLTQNLHTTASRTGVLIYISVAERFAEIIADEGISRQVGAKVWKIIIDDLTSHISRAEACLGLVRAIEAVGKLLAEHFPPVPHEANGLPNHLIVLPSGRT